MRGFAGWLGSGLLVLVMPMRLAAQDDATRARARFDSALVAEVTALARQRAAADSFSGVVLLARGDRQLLLLPLGYRDRERRLPNEGSTKFAIASMTKMFTGVAVGQLVQRGRLRFTDTVRMLAPALPSSLAGRLTVHQLLTHTSGLGSIWGDEFRRRGGDSFHAPRDFYPLFVNQPLQFEPGARWGYSNAGYVVLGDLIERVSGEGYADYIRRHVFLPAGMSTALDDEVSREDPDRAIPYSRQLSDSRGLERADRVGLRRMMPAGGAVASAPDLWRFARALTGHRLLNGAYTDTATTGKVTYRRGASYAHGFANEMVNGQVVIFHDGGAEGISGNLDIFPATGHVAIELSNYDHPAVGPIRDLMRARITRRASE
ncbi:MAG: serine hydrolase domain-containing protein [Gemmatimonadales bacterium]